MGAVQLIFIVCVLCVVINAQTQGTLQGVIRDQAPNTMLTPLTANDARTAGSCGTANGGKGFTGTDFQLPLNSYTNNEKGLCGTQCSGHNYATCGQLGADFTPQYAYTGTSPGNNIRSPASFYNWFHTTNETIVVDYSVPLVLDTNSKVGDVYTFNSNAFFPIDGQGWNDYQWNSDTYSSTRTKHNFAFCYEAHSRFGYQGGEVFSFTGDDDVWVYINNYLVIDLGSLHQSLSAQVSLDSLGLTRGQTYRFDFFYCERHTTASDMQVTTSLYFTCSYYDWCGVCEGTGQSCCTPAIIAGVCNDLDACTTDSCGVHNGSCVHTPITCVADQCSTVSCDKSRGCVQTPLNCVIPGNQCAVGTCSSATNGQCQYTNKTCDDGNKCTVDACDPAIGCTHTNRSCDDSNECTIDTCDPTYAASTTGCRNVQKSCDDNNKCTTDSCSPTTPGGCVNTNCNDGDPCTNDQCLGNSTGCSFTAKCSTGNPPNKCLVAACSSTGVCSTSALPCTAPDPCSVAQCDPNGGCLISTKNCDDGLACTVDACSAARGGCYYEALVCDDSNACTDNKCNNATGCYYPQRTDINDNLACTVDSCDKTTGISRTPLVCDDHNPCTNNLCNNATGCSYVDLSCDDSNDCTNDFCSNTTAVGQDPCVHQTIANCTGCTNATGQVVACTSTDRFCYPPVCDSNTKKCSNTTTKCDDQNACTNDYCANGGCSSTPVVCSPKNCMDVTCDRVKGCVYTNVTCDDSDPCTIDQCLASGSCLNTRIAQCTACGTTACITSDLCHPNVCNSATLSCQLTDFACPVTGQCTNSICRVVSNTTATCEYSDVSCPSTGDVCNPNTCDDTKGCGVVPIVCSSTNPCIVAQCEPSASNNNLTAQCVFSNKPCDVSDPCNPKICNVATGTCETQPVVCNDANACTNDKCVVSDGKATCSFVEKDCGVDQCGSLVCTNATTGACVSNVLSCDDGNPCTTDIAYCNGTNSLCNYTASGFCDDKNACTNEFCDSSQPDSPCSYSNITCFARNACETVDPANPCDNVTGCIYHPVGCLNQTDPCLVATCDPRAGCILENKVCLVSDNGCFKGVCDSNSTSSDPCTQVSRGSWGSRFSSNGVLCALRYDNAIKGAAIGTGAAVGIAIGAAAGAGLMGYGGKKGYDYWKTMQDQRFNGVQNNPLYEQTSGASDNPLYRHSTTL